MTDRPYSPAAPRYTLRLEERAGYLFAEITGDEDSSEITLAYWLELAAVCASRGTRCLLVVDRLRGTPPSAQELVRHVHVLRSTALLHVRIAVYEPIPVELPRLQHAELEAFDVGAKFRIFTSEREAEVWLRYGA
ncbi:MAG: hypothetical protein JSS28_01915 [Proteobacteria bacterium]|nr:hypothetical protein [Pseudomonadota bacterium]